MEEGKDPLGRRQLWRSRGWQKPRGLCPAAAAAALEPGRGDLMDPREGKEKERLLLRPVPRTASGIAGGANAMVLPRLPKLEELVEAREMLPKLPAHQHLEPAFRVPIQARVSVLQVLVGRWVGSISLASAGRLPHHQLWTDLGSTKALLPFLRNKCCEWGVSTCTFHAWNEI